MEKLSKYLLYRLRVYEPFFELLPDEDCLQEIKIALFSHPYGEQIKAARKSLYRLASELGYSRKKGKDNFEPFYTAPTFTEKQEQALKQIEVLYHLQGLTCKETCQRLGITYSNKIQKLFHQCFPKNAGWGGGRKKSGNSTKNENIN